MTDEQKQTCHKIADHYGEHNQMLKSVEEMAELIQVIMKIIVERYDSEFYADALTDEFYSELADVYIMVEQLQYIRNKKKGTLNRMAMYVNEKLKRQLKRMEDEANA